MKEYKFERLISLVLAVAMIVTLLPTNALAAGFSRRGDAVVAEGEETAGTEPAKSGDPEKSGEADKSGEPAKSDDPVVSGAPEKSGDPVTSGAPEASGEPVVSGAPEKSTEPEASEKSVTIAYKVKGGGGSVSPDSETVKETSGEAKGATANAAEGYEFKEWQNATGNKVGGNASFKPDKSDGAYKEATYYAVFVKAAEPEEESEEETKRKHAEDAEKMALAAMEELQKSKQAEADAAAEAEAAQKALDDAAANTALTEDERKALEAAAAEAKAKAEELKAAASLANDVLAKANENWDAADQEAKAAEAAADQKALEDAKADLGEEAALYLVKFVDGITNKVLARKAVAAGDSVTPPDAPAHEGYTFEGWDPEDMSAIAADTVYSAAYVSEAELEAAGLPMLASAFSVAGGPVESAYYITYTFQVGETTVDTQIVTAGDTLVDPGTPSVEGQNEFLGWYNGETKFEGFGTVGEVSADEAITLTAKFQEVYYVYFHNDGGTVIETIEASDGEKVDVSGVSYEVDATHAVVGWKLDGKAVTSVTINGANVTLEPIVDAVYWVNFHSNGGSAQESRYGLTGDTVDNLPIPERTGYTFKGWFKNADLSGTAVTSVSAACDLYAKWEGKSGVAYTVVYWQENANDDGYTYVEKADRTGTVGEDATYAKKSYTGFTLNTAKTAAAASKIAGDGTTIRNVYYARKTYTLTFEKEEWKWGSGYYEWTTAYTQSGIKYGQKTDTWWTEASNQNSGYLWFVAKNSDTAYSAPPTMPNGNLTVYGENISKVKNTLYYYEEDTEKQIHDPFAFYRNGWSFSREDYIEIAGFTFKEAEQSKDGKTGYLYYTRNSYKIEFYTNGGTSVSSVSGIKYEADISGKAPSAYTVGTTTKVVNGQTWYFAGWYDNEACAGDAFRFDGKTMPAHDLILYAKWTTKTYTVTLQYNNGDKDVTMTGIPVGSVVDEPESPSWEGYKFGGWLKDGKPFSFSTPIVADTTIVAKWLSLSSFSVTYNAGGAEGTVPEDSASYVGGAYAQVLAPTSLAYAGKKFAGWKSSVDGMIYQPNSKIEITQATTLTAQWVDPAALVTITYNSNYPKGASVTQTSAPQANNTEYTVIACPDGWSVNQYEFTGWNTQTDGEGTGYAAGDEIILGSTGTNKTLYAQWAKQQYKVTYYPSYEPNNNSKTFTYAVDTFTSTNPAVKNNTDADIGFTRAGYRFLGWSLRNDGGATRPVDFHPGDVLALSDFTGKSLGLYAVWSQELTVSYQYTGTAPTGVPPVPASSTAIAGDSVTVAAAPTCNGYEFSGWTVTTPATGVTISDGKFTMPKTNVVLTGSWKQTTYALTINYVYADNAKAAEPYEATLSVGGAYNVGSPAIMGYTPDQATVVGTMGESDVTVTVTYKATPYQVNYAAGATGVTGMPATNPVTVNYKETHNVAAAPTRAGYDFAGWATADVTGAEEIYGTGDNSFTMPAKDVTLTAQWTEKSKVTIYYRANDATVGSVSAASEGLNPEIGEAVGSTAEAKTGYHFVNWTLNNAEQSKTAAFTPARPATGWVNGTTYVANFAANTDTAYTVEHYKQNPDGTYPATASETEQKTGTTGAQVSATAKAYTGYTYDSTIEGTVASGAIAADGTLVLKLYYTLNSHTVTYSYTGTVPGDATALPAEASYQYGASVEVAHPATAEGYTFSGWKIDGSEAADFTMPDADVAITGSFTAIDYKVAYLPGTEDAVTGMPAGLTKQHIGVEITVAATVPVRADYVFAGWKTADTGASETTYGSGDIFTMPGKDVTLTAQWTAKSDVTIHYTVNDKAMGYVSSGSESLKPDSGIAVGSTAAAKPGYHFVNWTKQGDTSFTATTGALVPTKAAAEAWVDGTTYVANFAPTQYDYMVVLATYTTTKNDITYFKQYTGSADFGTLLSADEDGFTLGSAAEQTYDLTSKPAGFAYDSNSGPVTIEVKTGNETKNLLFVYFKADTVNYAVEHYLEKLGETGVYELNSAATEGKSGQVSTAAAYAAKTFEGFTYNAANTTWQYGAGAASKTALAIDANGSLVIKLYYDRNDVDYSILYYVDTILQDGTNGTEDWTETGSAEFGASLTAITPADKCPATHYLADTTYESQTVTADAEKNIIRVYYAEKGSIQVTFEDVTVTYDGQAHKLVPAVSGLDGLTAEKLHLAVELDGEAQGAGKINVKRNSSNAVVAYAGTLTGDASYTDGEGKVYAVNYNAEAAALTINPIAISVTAASEEKPYDGTPLENSGSDITSGKFVGSEGFDTVTVTGSITNVNENAADNNKITAYTFKTNTLLGNYDVTAVPGTLSITPVDPAVTVAFDQEIYNPGQTAKISWTAAGVNGAALTDGDGDVAIAVTLGGTVLAYDETEKTVQIPYDADVTKGLTATVTFTPKEESNYRSAEASDTAALEARGKFSVSLADRTVHYDGSEQTLAAPALTGAPEGLTFAALERGGITVAGGKGTDFGRYEGRFEKNGAAISNNVTYFTYEGKLYEVTLTGATLTVEPKLIYDGNGNTLGTAPAAAYGSYQSTAQTYTATAAQKGDLVKTGYDFLGWAKNKDATAVDYAAGTTIPLEANETTVYAVWKAVDYKVSYAFTGSAPVGGFPGLPLETTQNHVGDTVARAADASKAGYTFSGWTASPEVTVGTDGKFTMPASDVVFTGSFTAVEYAVTYAYDSTKPEDASPLPTGETAKHIGDPITVAPDATSASHDFVGWTATYVDGSGNPQTITISGDPRAFTMPAANVTITGSFKIKTYTVTFKAAAGGSITNDADDSVQDGMFVTTVDYGTAFSEVTKGVAAADSAHFFTGWTPAFPADGAKVTDHLVFEAQFASKKALSFRAEEDSVIYDGQTHTLPVNVYVDNVKVGDEAKKAAFIAKANVSIDSKTEPGTYSLAPAGSTDDIVVDGVTYTTAYTGANLAIEKRPTATTVQTDLSVYYAGDSMVVSGSVKDAGNPAIADIPTGEVELTIYDPANNQTATIPVTVGADGSFTYTQALTADDMKAPGSYQITASYQGDAHFNKSESKTSYAVRARIPYTIRYEFETLTAGAYEARPDLVAADWTTGGEGRLGDVIGAPVGWDTLSPTGFTANAAGSTTSVTLADLTADQAGNELVLRFNRERVTVTFQPGAHGSLDGADANGNVVFEVISGAAMPQAPGVNSASHYYHIDWAPEYDPNATVTENLIFTTQYGEMVRMTVQFRILGTSTSIRVNAVTWHMPGDHYDYSSGTATARHYRVSAAYTYNSSRGDFTTRFTNAEAGVAEGRGRVVTLYYVMNSATPTPSVTPTSTPTPNVTGTPTTVPTTKVTDNPVPLMDDETPLAAPERAWALLNLILMLLTALASILMLIGYFGKKKQEEKDGKNGELKMYDVKKHGFMRFISLVPAIGAIIAFILTEDMRLPMVFTDQWTLLMVAIAIIQAGVALLAKRDKEEDENPEIQQ